MDIEIFNSEFNKGIEHLKKDLQSLRSGRATPALVENIQVDSYSVKTPIIQLANIHTPEFRLLVIEPWDKTLIKDIEKAINDAGINLSPTNDGNVIRIKIPPMTEESRKEIVKILHQKLEEARIVVRHTREEIMKELKNEKETGKIGEDDYFSQQKKIQEKVDYYNNIIKELGDKKEEEIMTV